jgi:hypothetical protein
MEKHGQRYEDIGLGRVLRYLPLLALIFTAGAWYQSSKTNDILANDFKTELADHEHRMTKVEDAIVYLSQIVKYDRANH